MKPYNCARRSTSIEKTNGRRKSLDTFSDTQKDSCVKLSTRIVLRFFLDYYNISMILRFAKKIYHFSFYFSFIVLFFTNAEFLYRPKILGFYIFYSAREPVWCYFWFNVFFWIFLRHYSKSDLFFFYSPFYLSK